ncbi:hypothetical protein [Subtercola sp. RTI3]|uniref:hypothetical protein n=1 Tax=Subtercola sp. RTI3 TaxID=3048639 RepID=UPI002B2310E5|nr:hypothetical protein [Subtercola sp. RTI3]MEA9987181.1 hypothetical protein [Subtercola sp. RTI3]
MFKTNAIRVASVGIVVAALMGATTTSAFAADPAQPVNSTAPIFLLDAATGDPIAAGTTLAFNKQVVASPTATNDGTVVYPGVADATDVRTFIAPVGSERTPSAWSAIAPGGFYPGTHDVLLPTMTLDSHTNGNLASVKANGGTYSLGFALTNNNALSIASGAVYYTTITVTPVTGAWTFATPVATGPATPPSGSFDQNIAATTVAAQDGTLNLVSSAKTTNVLNAATLVNNLSTSTGTVGNFTVQDGRVVSHPGWTVTSSVTDFTNGTTTIDKKQLGITPKAGATALPAGVTLAVAQAAGSAVNPALLASSGLTAAIASTDLDADLTFVAPADKPAGTYTAKLTITLASK